MYDVIYNEKLTDVNRALREFNNAQPNLQFTMADEQNNKIKSLYITVEKKSYNIYRKPTATNTIHNTSCHPTQHECQPLII